MSHHETTRDYILLRLSDEIVMKVPPDNEHHVITLILL
jgi:hypothetical protein